LAEDQHPVCALGPRGAYPPLGSGELGERLVDEAGKAVQAGWAQAARLMVVVAVFAAAIALIVVTSR
jgi:hypothetical protein